MKLGCCKTDLCEECFTDWTTAHFQKQALDFVWKCPNGECGTERSIEDILGDIRSTAAWQPGTQEMICDLAFKRYLRNASDVKVCPFFGCDYQGYLEVDDVSKCTEPLRCD